MIQRVSNGGINAYVVDMDSEIAKELDQKFGFLAYAGEAPELERVTLLEVDGALEFQYSYSEGTHELQT